ncbi:unnamed protein product [Effrenium voratum]|uniref:Uncharacterized protein n=1 Tax=Effrenium voratum TaxID=2562239 RepID=A0AA36ILV6_9DINO|nr:unnamed protein product [Effrenium voratum]
MALKFAEIALLMWQVALAAGVSIDLHGRRDGRDVKIEDLKFEGMDAWTNVFKSVGRGEQADPSSLMKLAGIENATEPEQLDPQLKAELGQQSVQDRALQYSQPHQQARDACEGAGGESPGATAGTRQPHDAGDHPQPGSPADALQQSDLGEAAGRGKHRSVRR